MIVVGPELAEQYAHGSARCSQISVSLISAADVDAGKLAATRPYDGELQVLSVGRIDREKNPLLLAEIMADIRAVEPRWRLVGVRGRPDAAPAQHEISQLGLARSRRARGYVPVDGGLLDLYRRSHVFLHVSLTEGMPQVLLEAFASRAAGAWHRGRRRAPRRPAGPRR